MEIKHHELYDMLRFWRNEQVEITQKLHYQILSQQAVIEISNQLPCTLNQLKKIHGIGKVKLQQYGDDLLEMVLDYMGENGLELNEDPPESPKKTGNNEEKQSVRKRNKETRKTPPSSSGLGYLVFIQKIAGSNPAGGSFGVSACAPHLC